MVKIWQLTEPEDSPFAEAGRRGTWGEVEGKPAVCPECTGTNDIRIQPLLIEWEPGSSVVGDFSWPGLSDDVAVTEQVANALEAQFRGFERGPVEMVQDPRLKRPSRITKRTKPRVWLPYDGPPLCDLWVTKWVGMDRERSSARLKRKCRTCGEEYFDLEGVEKREGYWDQRRLKHFRILVPRQAGKGLYIRKRELSGADIFRVIEFPSPVFCTDRVKHFIQDHEFTNITFLEMGEVF